MINPFTWLTREWRTQKALKHMIPGESHLDIGCGPARYLLNKSPYRKKFGLDMQTGEKLEKKILHENESIDCITMMAVIEHLEYVPDIISECRRILKPEGRLIISTPYQKGYWLMQIYAPGFEDKEGPHHTHYSCDSIKKLVDGKFTIKHFEEFMFGFNMFFVCTKI